MTPAAFTHLTRWRCAAAVRSVRIAGKILMTGSGHRVLKRVASKFPGRDKGPEPVSSARD